MSTVDLLQGTLDLMILQTLVLGPAHGHTIAHAIEHRSHEVLQVEHGSLYPALHRLERKKWIKSEWTVSDKNQKVKAYSLTAAGKKQLVEERSNWERLSAGMAGILYPSEKESEI